MVRLGPQGESRAQIERRVRVLSSHSVDYHSDHPHPPTHHPIPTPPGSLWTADGCKRAAGEVGRGVCILRVDRDSRGAQI